MLRVKYALSDDDSIRPICPHCDKQIDADILMFEQTPGPSATHLGMPTSRLFACPSCHKVLGISTTG